MKKTTFVVFLAGTLAASAALAADGPGAPSILSMQTSVRFQGMGNASIAAADDAQALFLNPAGLGFARRYELTGSMLRGFEELQQNNLGLTVPFGDVSASNVETFGTVGVGIASLDYGNFEGKDRAGNSAGGFSASDHLVSLGYGQQFRGCFAIGAKAKSYKREIANARATGTAFDFGGMYRTIRGNWSVGATAFNVGGTSLYAQKQEELPQSFVYGAAYSSTGNAPERANGFNLALDMEKPQNGDSQIRGGGEYWINSLYAVRLGYDSRLETGSGITAGFGLAIKEMEFRFFPIEQILLDYAFIPGGDLSNINSISLAVKIGLP